jgi:hypothetical protein
MYIVIKAAWMVPDGRFKAIPYMVPLPPDIWHIVNTSPHNARIDEMVCQTFVKSNIGGEKVGFYWLNP